MRKLKRKRKPSHDSSETVAKLSALITAAQKRHDDDTAVIASLRTTVDELEYRTEAVARIAAVARAKNILLLAMLDEAEREAARLKRLGSGCEWCHEDLVDVPDMITGEVRQARCPYC
jgi:hypothetical protein